MIYEAIFYQGMTIDLNTTKKPTHTHTHAWRHTRSFFDTDDNTHKSHFDVPTLSGGVVFVLTYPIYLSFTLINTKTHKPAAWYGFDEWSDWQHCALLKIPRMLERTSRKSIWPLFCLCWFHIFSRCCFKYWLSPRPGRNTTTSQCRCSIQYITRAGTPGWGLLTDNTLAAFYYSASCWSCVALPVEIAGSYFRVYWKACGFRYWLMSNEMALSYYRRKILIWATLSEKKGAFIMLAARSIIS